MSFSYLNYQTASPIVARLAQVLNQIDPDTHYANWLKALMAIFYETRGSKEGFELADEWSSAGRKYKGTREIQSKWHGFKLDHPRPIRMGTLIRIANSQGSD